MAASSAAVGDAGLRAQAAVPPARLMAGGPG
jgi:hypothetical protein